MCRLILAGVVLLACSGDRRVPFGEDHQDPVAPLPTERAHAFEPETGRALPAQTTQISLEGADLSGVGELRALLPLDLDADGDRDALVVTADNGAIGVSIARRDASRFTLSVAATLPDEGCSIASASIDAPTPERFIARANLTCDEAPDWSVWWVLSRSARPRVLETLSRRSGEIAFSFDDLDDDGHPDVSAQTSVDGHTLTLRFMDRPSGLAREQGALTAFLQGVRSDDSSAAVLLAGKLCRSDQAVLRIGTGVWGMACPAGLQEQAASAQIIDALGQGSLLDAISMIEGEPSAPVVQALDAAARSDVQRVRRATFRGSPDRATAHVGLRFEGDDLIVRGALAERYRPGSSEGIAADAAPAPTTDSAGRFFVQSLQQTCQGVQLHLLPAAELGPGVGFARSQSMRVVDTSLEDCTRDPGDQGWRALGWAPQGLLIARLGVRVVVPLTADGLPAGDPVTLEDDDLPPAPLRGGRITPGGETWILETPHGVLRRSPAGWELWRPQPWEAPLAAALSEDGQQVALVQGDGIFVLQATPN